MIHLTSLDLSMAALLIVLLALISLAMELGLAKKIIIAGARTTVQLLLVGLVLRFLFDNVNAGVLILTALFMLFVAGREVVARQKRRFTGIWGLGIGTFSMFLSSFTIAIMALTVIINAEPWYEPRYAIPLLGMLLGNTMSGIAIGLDRLTTAAWEHRAIIEARLMLGQRADDAISRIRRDCIQNGLIPIINVMSVAGIVSLPGMMTGQILSGTPPIEAVKYQILILFLIAGGTGLGTVSAVWLGSRRLFDDRQRLRLDRLRKS